jgi:hypothetical protein
MKKLICLIFLSIISSSVFSASDAYKCNISATYKLGADGMLYIDEDNPYGDYEKGFTFDRETGRMLGGDGGMLGGGETFTILQQGSDTHAFKASFVQENYDWVLSFWVTEYATTYKKPFIFTQLPHMAVFSGTCINY